MKYALVTGAFGGMGSSVTEELRRNGYFVFALDRNVHVCGENVLPIKCDVTDEESINKAFTAISEVTDTLDAVLHFAGIYMLDSFIEVETERLDRIFDINLRGAILINKTIMPLLRKNSRIIMTTSELAPLEPLPFTGIYAVTKSALDKYAFSLKMELQLLDIKVSVIRAGAVNTGMLGVSTSELEKFCDKTTIYKCNAERFKKIVDSIESRSVSPEKLAEKAVSILKKNSPAFSYSINRNPLLLLMSALPKRLQLFIIKLILK